MAQDVALSVLKPGESQANQDEWVTLDEAHGPSLQTLCGSHTTCFFYLTGQNLITWPRLAAREARKWRFYSGGHIFS